MPAKKTARKNNVKVRDLKPTKSPKGGGVKFGDIVITKPIDKTSPNLMH